MYNEILIECANLALFGLDDAVAGVVIGSIIGGIVNLVGNLINSSSTKKTNERNIQVTQEENALAREHEETMYNRYESIPAQAQQYREAGLNPMQAVSPQSIGHASTSPMPQSQSPQFGNALIDSFPAFLEAGTTLRQQRIQRQEEITKELENWKRAFENGTAEEQFKLQKEEIQSRIALSRADKRKRDKEIEQLELTYNMAKEAYDNGINSFIDEHNESVALVEQIKANTNKINSDKEYIDALTKTENQLRSGKVTAQTISNNIAAIEYELKKLYGEKVANLEYRQIKESVERSERLRDFYDQIVKDEQAIKNYQKVLTKINLDDMQTLTPTQRYILQFTKEVVAKGADLVF